MGWKFRKSFKICKGLRFNISKKSFGLSIGSKGARYSINSSRKNTTSIGIPGTGLSYNKTTSSKTGKNTKSNLKKSEKTNDKKISYSKNNIYIEKFNQYCKKQYYDIKDNPKLIIKKWWFWSLIIILIYSILTPVPSEKLNTSKYNNVNQVKNTITDSNNVISH